MVLRSHEELISLYPHEKYLQLSPFSKNKKKKKDFFCRDAYQMSWDMKKVETLYKVIKRQAKLLLCFNYKIYLTDNNINPREMESSSSPLLLNESRINISQRKKITDSLQLLIQMLTHYKSKIEEILSPHLYPNDIQEYLNVTNLN